MIKLWERMLAAALCLVATVALTTLTSADAHASNSNLWFDDTLTVTCGNCVATVSIKVWANGPGVPAPFQVSVVASDDCSQWYQNNSSSNIDPIDGGWVSNTKIHVVGSSCSSKFHIGVGKP